MIYIICGPTCSGKTSLANELSDKLNAPIVNADAFQIYKDMNIGTAKIEKSDYHYSKYFLLDFLTPDKTYSVKQYQDDFRRVIANLSKDNNDIVVVGGTGLYIKAAIYDYKFEEQEDDDVSDLEKLSNDELWETLSSIDKNACLTIHPNNRKRVIRAISIARTHEEKKSDNISSQEHKLIYDNVRIIMLSPERSFMYENINNRVDEMFNLGLVDEVKSLLNKYDLSSTARAAIGYKEVIDYLDGSISIEACKDLIKQRTRNYAKRQVTFFKNQFELETYSLKEDALKGLGL